MFEQLHGMLFNARRLATEEVIDPIRFDNYHRTPPVLGCVSPKVFETNLLAYRQRAAALWISFAAASMRAGSFFMLAYLTNTHSGCRSG